MDASDLWVSFDDAPVLRAATLLPVKAYYYDPLAWHDSSDAHNVAVGLLEKPVKKIIPAALPPAGLLDQMKEGKMLQDQVFVAVGYGDVRDDKTGGSQLFP